MHYLQTQSDAFDPTAQAQLRPWELAESTSQAPTMYSVRKALSAEIKKRQPSLTQFATYQVDGKSSWVRPLILGPTGPSLLVSRNTLHKAEERNCCSGARHQEKPLKPVEEKQSVLLKTKISSGGSQGRRSGSCGDTDRWLHCVSWTFLWWWNSKTTMNSKVLKSSWPNKI